MPEKIFCYVPEVCVTQGENLSVQVRGQLLKALESNVEPGSFPNATAGHAVLLDDDLIKRIREMATEHNRVPGRIVGGLLYAMYLAGRDQEGQQKKSVGKIVEPVIAGLRPGQSRVLQEVVPLLNRGRVAFSECGTGSGKGRLVAHAAAYLLDARDAGQVAPQPDLGQSLGTGGGSALPEYLQSHIRKAVEVHQQRIASAADAPGCVIACAPSIENVAHLVREWEVVRPQVDPKGLRRVAVRLGRGQFVNPTALESLLEFAESDGFENPKVRAWLDGGMPAGKTDATRALLKLEPGLRGLMVDLMAIAQGEESTVPLDLKSCALVEGDVTEEGGEEQNFQDHMERFSEGFDLLFTTTAMLCLDSLLLTQEKRSPLLPVRVIGLLIDEAHQLESIQANLAAKSLSISRMLSDLIKLKRGGGKQVDAIIRLVQDMKGTLSGFADESALPPPLTDMQGRFRWVEAMDQMSKASTKITALLKTVSANGSRPEIGKCMKSLEAAAAVMKAVSKESQTPLRGVISHTPVRGYISMTFGPSSVIRNLMARWAVTPCAMLLSGTLNHITVSGASGRFMAAMLGALARFDQTNPLMPDWLFTTPTLYLPGQQNFHRYVPPKRDEITEASMRAWAENVARVVVRAASDARGGMLVLMTGFQRLEVLADELRKALPADDVERLLVHSRHAGVSVQADEFRKMYGAGIRPIWLATGAAWTGLDLSDKGASPGDDFLLTDLMIPAVPFGLERSTTHAARMRNMGFAAELVEVQRRLRQGLGRLVRREGVQGRRIWILDGRLVNPVNSTRFEDVRRPLKAYLKRGRI